MSSDRKKLIKEIISSASRAKIQAATIAILVFGCITITGGYFLLGSQSGRVDTVAQKEGGPSSHPVFSVLGLTMASSPSVADELSQIEDASSEKNGKWFGLCKKRSVNSINDFRRTVENDPALSVYYSGFNWEEAKLGSLKEDVMAYVSHRKGDVIKKTAKAIKLPKGDGYITDGVRTARTYCCNDIVLTPSAGPPNTLLPPPAVPPVGTLGAPPELFVPKGTPPATFSFPSVSDIPGTSVYPLGRRTSSQNPSDPPSHPPSSPVPEPGTLFLMGAGLVALAAVGRKNNFRSRN
ncbi:MAG: PEP-CTERM sorting domain-containing protein [Desulfobulbus sp.]